MSGKDIVTGTFRDFFGTHLFLYVFHVYFGWLATQPPPPPPPPPLLDPPLEYHHQNALTEKA